MSYIEEKYRAKIYDIFNEELPQWEEYLLELLNKKSLKAIDDIAKVCSDFNKNINLILKQYYPEIKDMDEKLNIKSTLKFYFDLIDYLVSLVRDIENFQKIPDEYYKILIDFVEKKETLISGKYRDICRLELTCFYDKKTRDNLENVLEEKLELQSKEFFTFGSLEQEIKKIAKIAGAKEVKIKAAEDSEDKLSLPSAQSVIYFTNDLDDETTIKKISVELQRYLESKGYDTETTANSIVTNAKLLPDMK